MELKISGRSLLHRNAESFTGIPIFTIIPLLMLALIASCHHKKEDGLLWLLFLGNRGGGPGAPGIVADPAFTPQPGTFSNDQSVAISTATPGAVIHYTTDGSTPTAASAVYSAPVAVVGDGASVMIQAIAVKSGMVESSAVSAGYTINYSQVSTPQFAPPGGTYNSDQAVIITSSTLGATIHYTTNGTTPTTSSTVYAGPIPVSGHGTSTTIRAIAVKAGMADSTVAGSTYSIAYSPAADPTFSPTLGTYNTDQAVTISTTTTGATVHYTTDGTVPTAACAAYSAPIPVAGNGTNMTIKAIAVKTGMLDSSTAASNYTINYGQVSTPQFDPPGGNYSADQIVTITTSTVGATIHYTMDGSTPTVASAIYSAPIPVSGHGTIANIQAIAVATGMLDSTVAGAIFTVNWNTVAAPSFTPVPGTYNSNKAVTITTSTTGATIHYTTDGTAPTTVSAVYAAPISVAGNGTNMAIKAIAVMAGMLNSAVVTGNYSIIYPPAPPAGVTIVPSVGKLTISWIPGASATSFNIYWNTTGNPTTASPKISTTAFSYSHSGLISGKTYYYIVTSVNAGGESAPTTVKSGIPL